MTTASKNPASQGRTGFFIGRKMGSKTIQDGPTRRRANSCGMPQGKKDKGIYRRNCEGILKNDLSSFPDIPSFFMLSR